MVNSGNTFTYDDSMDRILNEFFILVFTREELSNLPEATVKFTGEVSLSTMHVCPEKWS